MCHSQVELKQNLCPDRNFRNMRQISVVCASKSSSNKHRYSIDSVVLSYCDTFLALQSKVGGRNVAMTATRMILHLFTTRLLVKDSGSVLTT